MSKLHNDRELLSMKLIKKYREGTLTAAEEAQLNTLQAEDPFIADALEGIEVLADGDTFAKDVDDLRKQLKQRVKSSKRIGIYWPAIAASLVLLMAAFYVLFTFVQPAEDTKDQAIQSISSEGDTTEFVPLDNELPTISMRPPGELSSGQNMQKSALPNALKKVEAQPEPSHAFSSSPSETFSTIESLSNADDIKQNRLSQRRLSEIQIEVQEKVNDAGLRKKENEQPAPDKPSLYDDISRTHDIRPIVGGNEYVEARIITGQVLDGESGSPVQGANVVVKGTAIGTLTDLNGKFELSIPQNYDQLEFSSIGYETNLATVDKRNALTVSLEQDVNMLSEVVVVGYGVQEKRDFMGSVSSERNDSNTIVAAKPLQGMSAFKKYLREQQRYPENWKEGDKETVKLSFTVTAEGKKTDYMIEKSGGTWLDQEAIRLIEEGPDWEAASRNGEAISQEVSLKIRFKK